MLKKNTGMGIYDVFRNFENFRKCMGNWVYMTSYTNGNEMTPGTIFFKSERAEQGHGTFANERDNQAQNYGSRSGS